MRVTDCQPPFCISPQDQHPGHMFAFRRGKLIGNHLPSTPMKDGEPSEVYEKNAYRPHTSITRHVLLQSAGDPIPLEKARK